MSMEMMALIGSFRTLADLTSAMVKIRDATLLNAKIVEFQQAMIEANSHVLAVQQEHHADAAKIRELEAEVKRLIDWSAEKDRCRLQQVQDGVFVYVDKSTTGSYETAVKFCCNCFDQGAKSILQQGIERVGRGSRLDCPRCKFSVVFHGYKS